MGETGPEAEWLGPRPAPCVRHGHCPHGPHWRCLGYCGYLPPAAGAGSLTWLLVVGPLGSLRTWAPPQRRPSRTGSTMTSAPVMGETMHAWTFGLLASAGQPPCDPRYLLGSAHRSCPPQSCRQPALLAGVLRGGQWPCASVARLGRRPAPAAMSWLSGFQGPREPLCGIWEHGATPEERG